MKVLVWSIAPWLGSAYAKQGHGIAKGLKDKGYDVVYLCVYGFEGGPKEWKELPGVPIWGRSDGTMGIGVIGELIYNLRIEHVIQHFDTWQLGDFLPKSGLGNLITCYAPIESEDIPPATLQASMDCFIVCPSETGQKAWQKINVPAVWIPHGIDLNLYKPVSIEDKAKLRQGFNIPADAFVFCLVAQNNWRKNLGMQLEAFTEISREHDAYLILYTALQEDPVKPGGASDLAHLIAELGIGERVRTPLQWLLGFYPEEDMAKIYQASDVNLFATCAEGFGLPIIEAGACGIPSIVTDFAAAPEICGKGGLKVHPATKYYRMSPGTHAAYPDYNGLITAMRQMINNQPDYQALCDYALANAQLYSWDKVVTYWHYYLQGRPQVEISKNKIDIKEKVTGD